MVAETQDFEEGFIQALIEDGQTEADASLAYIEYLNTTVTKDVILGVVGDLVSDFMYHDRKEDDDLPRGAIEKALATGVLTVDEIVEKFREEIEKGA